MPTVYSSKLYSVFFIFLLKLRLQNYVQNPLDETSKSPFGVTSRPEESVTPANLSFSDGVANKDLHIDPLTSLSIRIFLPDTCLVSPDFDSRTRVRALNKRSDLEFKSVSGEPNQALLRRNSSGPSEKAM